MSDKKEITYSTIEKMVEKISNGLYAKIRDILLEDGYTLINDKKEVSNEKQQG